MDDIEPSVLTYTAFRNRQLLEAWRRKRSEYQAQHAGHPDTGDFEDEDLDEPPPRSLPF
jgi:hypothetical protein